ncbi:MAG: GNAT family N-acetyltransferase [Pseudonocardia sp.]
MVSPGAADPRWSLTWEDDVGDGEHVALAGLFAGCFPQARIPFTGARSWSSGRPELRVIGWHGGRPVAHLGILRRFLRVAERDASQLVGDIGLVAVDPDLQGRGIGAELLARSAATLRALDLPFGFLTCGEQVAGFYAASGWVRATGRTRMVRADGRVQVYGGASMVLPVHASLDVWPMGCTVDRNGLEV